LSVTCVTVYLENSDLMSVLNLQIEISTGNFIIAKFSRKIYGFTIIYNIL
jgi:hypothetical protein